MEARDTVDATAPPAGQEVEPAPAPGAMSQGALRAGPPLPASGRSGVGRSAAGRSVRLVLPAVVSLAAVIGAWQLLADHNRYLLPPPGPTLTQLLHHPGLYASNARSTLAEALIGLAVGYGIALVLAVAMARLRLVYRAVMPLAVVLNVTPVVAVAPAMVVAFGFGRTPKVIVTAIIVVFPALINALTGLRSADPKVLDVMTTLHASPREVLWRVQLPSALPNLFAAARVCLPLSVVGAVVAEFVAPGSSAGLGTLITQASANNRLDRVYAAIICLAAMGVGLTVAIAVVERWLLAWQRDPDRRR